MFKYIKIITILTKINIAVNILFSSVTVIVKKKKKKRRRKKNEEEKKMSIQSKKKLNYILYITYQRPGTK